MSRPRDLLNLFVYGTLKKGGSNHDAFCRGVVSIEPALIRGRLYVHASGFPVVAVPSEDIFAQGSEDLRKDLLAPSLFPRHAPGFPKWYDHGAGPTGGWRPIHGELLTFDDPERRLPAIDALEEFHPEEPTLYQRVLIPARVGRSASLVPVWAYVLASAADGLQELHADRWDCRHSPADVPS